MSIEHPDNDVMVYSPDSSYWSVWQTARHLQTKLAAATETSVYAATTRDVCHVLHFWGKVFAGQPPMASFLRNSSQLLHETEECIVALHHFKDWWDTTDQQQSTLTVVDVGCGKGYFAMFLSYLIGLVWNNNNNNNNMTIGSIILLDKARRSEINYTHVDVANQTAVEQKRPRLELWDATNLHDHDTLIDRLVQYNNKNDTTTTTTNHCLALVGIHLCKMASPAFISLVNGLGPNVCPYACLAPCCLPKSIASGKSPLSIYAYETAHSRQRRLSYRQQRCAARPCALCQSTQHLARTCPEYKNRSPEDRAQLIQQAAKNSCPCWKCGILGHFAKNCVTSLGGDNDDWKPTTTPKARQFWLPPPSSSNNNNNNHNPFDTYCQVLAQGFDQLSVQTIHSGLVNENVAHNKDDKNWSGQRKALFLVASATTTVA